VNRIRVLDRSVAERIAAGEVVERPASVVKELVENSLDAGARRISVEIEGAGLRLIRVTDDGEGIAAADVPIAFARFATSKIARVEDLDTVTSYGFRGEALASIAAVARVALVTRTSGATGATRARVSAGTVEEIHGHGAPPGTTVEVRDLFFTTPARLKFMKSHAREQALIAETVQRAAMAHPEVAMRLAFDGREAAHWPKAAADDRVADILAAGRHGDLVPAAGSVPGGAMRGWLGRPERARPNRTGQHVFVNGRPIQSALVRRAVEQGYAQLVPAGRFPIFAVFLDVHPATVDVNIHPRKLEARFRDESDLFGAVSRHVRAALLGGSLIREIAAPAVAGATAAPATSVEALDLAAAREGLAAYDAGAAARRLPPLRLIGQALRTYLLAEGAGRLYLIDQHAAHERVLYERLIEGHRRGATSQALAVPIPIELSPAQTALLAGARDRLAQLGFEIEAFGARTALLRAVPAGIPGATLGDLIHRALAALAGDGDAPGRDPLERLAIATACHSAIRAGDPLDPDSAAALLASLEAADDPFTCFHGRPTIVAISREQLERWFLRS
jgi:DNA mismatch repair protein MutL